jgi:6-phosphogluconolactonase
MDHESLEMELVNFENKAQLEVQLAKKIAYDLEIAIHQKGHANLLVSGGSTPINLFNKLANLEIEWDKVSIGLVDERWVDATSEFSNEKLAKENLIQGFASKANFIGMVFNTKDELENLIQANSHYKQFIEQGIDVVILGMGDDGHTASLFPNDEISEKDLNLGENLGLISTRAPKHPVERISCSKTLLLSSTSIYLMIIGKEKLDTLSEAETKKYPIAYFTSANQIKTYYSEKK